MPQIEQVKHTAADVGALMSTWCCCYCCQCVVQGHSVLHARSAHGVLRCKQPCADASRLSHSRGQATYCGASCLTAQTACPLYATCKAEEGPKLVQRAVTASMLLTAAAVAAAPAQCAVACMAMNLPLTAHKWCLQCLANMLPPTAFCLLSKAWACRHGSMHSWNTRQSTSAAAVHMKLQVDLHVPHQCMSHATRPKQAQGGCRQ